MLIDLTKFFETTRAIAAETEEDALPFDTEAARRLADSPERGRRQTARLADELRAACATIEWLGAGLSALVSTAELHCNEPTPRSLNALSVAVCAIREAMLHGPQMPPARPPLALVKRAGATAKPAALAAKRLNELRDALRTAKEISHELRQAMAQAMAAEADADG